MSTGEQIEFIQTMVAERHGFTVADLFRHDQHQPLAWVRQVAMWICRETPLIVCGRPLGKISLHQIGFAFGKRDNSTVVAACRRVRDEMECYPSARESLESLRAECLREIADRLKTTEQ